MTVFGHISHCTRTFARTYASKAPQKTFLYDFHVENGGKMVDFGGWNMPVQYKDLSIAQSSLHTRQNSSVFDVSHMLQTNIYGKDRNSFLESLTPTDVQGLSKDTGTLSVFLTEAGGILDDLIINNVGNEYLYVVTNAGCIEQDLKHMVDNAEEWRGRGKDVVVEPMHGRGLIAFQGPKATEILQKGVKESLSNLYFMHSKVIEVFGISECRVTRCGYTGEDGFEISVAPEKSRELVEKLVNQSPSVVKLAGLGARDALRLEAGLCLYGNDIDTKTTPVQAGLTWLIAKNRREKGDFPGSATILSQIKNKVQSKRVGFISEPGRVPRGGTKIVDIAGENIGRITSGCPSPCLKANISMGYIEINHSKIGTAVHMDVSGKGKDLVDATVTKMPFVPAKYYMQPKKA